MGRLSGKVAIITGAARGMGLMHVKRFLAEGAAVAMTDIDFALLEREAAELDGQIIALDHDVTKAASWQAVIERAEGEFDRIDVLVNNAGIGLQEPVDTMDEAIFRKILEVNQLGTFLGMKAVVAPMRRAGGGSIVNISSTCGLSAIPGTVAYAGTKFALRGMTKAAAVDLGKDRIRVNSVHPGLTRTEMLTPELEERMCQRVPLGRVADADEVSSIVLYLASDDSSYSTGAEFVVDGGLTAHH